MNDCLCTHEWKAHEDVWYFDDHPYIDPGTILIASHNGNCALCECDHYFMEWTPQALVSLPW